MKNALSAPTVKRSGPPTAGEPREVKYGSVAVMVYFTPNHVAGTDYPAYTISYKLGEQRIRKKFSRFDGDDGAEKAAKLAAERISHAKGDALSLEPKQVRQYIEAIHALTPLGVSFSDVVREYVEARKALAPIGVPVGQAVREYSEATGKLPKGRKLADAVDAFTTYFKDLEDVSVRDAVDRFVSQKESATKHGRPASDEYLKEMRTRLGRFADAHPGTSLSAIRAEHVAAFLNGLELAARSRWNHKRLLGTFFEYAKRQRLYPKNVDPFETDEVDFEDESVIGIFKPDEMARMLAAARLELVPFLALGAFAGLRTAEIQRLEWSDIDLVNRRIVLAKERTKTRSRRIVPVSDNLAAWLAPYAQSAGPVVPFANVAKQIIALVEDVNAAKDGEPHPAALAWKHNALRHSFITYRLAEVQNTAQVALEAGNSETMIFKHYRDLATKQDAAAWFAVGPTRAANVVPLSAAAAS